MIKRILRKIKRFSDKMFGTWVDEIYWRNRKEWAAEVYASSISHPHREFLLEAIARHEPFSSVLEIGSASGPNLYLLAKKYPKVRMLGIDISPVFIEHGRKWFKEKDIGNVELEVGKADKLRVPDKSFDITITDATLVCLAPDKIKKAVSEIIRVTKKSVIMVEWHSEKTIYRDHWAYNYKDLFKGYKIKMSPIEGWDDNWDDLGRIIEVNL